MNEIFNQLLQFLQQGIAAIFRFVELIWTWSVGQLNALMRVPWQDWALWKQIFFVLILAAVIWALFRAVKELWDAGERILSGFAALLGALVRTLPAAIVAGVIALGGLWILNNVDLAAMQVTGLNQPSQR